MKPQHESRNRQHTGIAELRGAGRRSLLPALIASGACGLAASPASALQLGDIEIHSSLGQPLRASIAFALSPNEQVGDYCIFLKPAAAAMPAVSQALLSVSNGRINIQGSVPLREPLVSLGISVECPYTARLTRDYMLMIDPAPVATNNVMFADERTRAPDAPESGTARDAAATQGRNSFDDNRRDGRDRPAGTAPPIAPATTYRVRVGDSLSSIVARIDNRSMGLWPAVQVLFDTNPDAFLDGDMNRLKAGALLTIPSLDGSTAATVAARSSAAAGTARQVPAVAATTMSEPAAEQPVSTSYAGFAAVTVDPAVAVEAAPGTPTMSEAAAEPAAVADAADIDLPAADATGDQTADLHPGMSADRETAGATPGALPAGTLTNFAPSAAPQERAAADGAEQGFDVAPWLVGAGTLAAGIFAVFAFGRRRQFTLNPTAARREEAAYGFADPAADDLGAESTDTIADDDPTAENRILAGRDMRGTYDYTEITEVGDTEMSLDVDLGNGDGFHSGEYVQLSNDFAFSTTDDLAAEVDVDLRADDDEFDEDKSPTDIIAPFLAEAHRILDREILPADEDEDTGYDLSIIMDATKQRYSAESDVTAKDLEAIAIEGTINGTMSRTAEFPMDDADYQILEHDFDDESAETQVLKEEIRKAAREMDLDIDPATDDVLAATAEITANVPADATAVAEDEDVIEGDKTAEIPEAVVESRRLQDTMVNSEVTVELPSAENDETAAIGPSGTVKTGS